MPEYVRAFQAPGALRAGFDDYRATFPDDLDADEASAAAGQRLRMPVLALWGDGGLPSRLPVLDIWRRYADDVRGQAVAGCGHFLPRSSPTRSRGTCSPSSPADLPILGGHDSTATGCGGPRSTSSRCGMPTSGGCGWGTRSGSWASS